MWAFYFLIAFAVGCCTVGFICGFLDYKAESNDDSNNPFIDITTCINHYYRKGKIRYPSANGYGSGRT